VAWYVESFETLKTEYTKRLASLGLLNITVIKHDDLPTQLFGDDLVHLTPAVGLKFLNAVLYLSDMAFQASLVDLEGDVAMEVSPTAGSDVLALAQPAQPAQPKTTEERLNEVIQDIEKRRSNDDLVFARI
jgi:hypothetical protein